MEIDCSINCFSPELNGSHGANHHHPGFLSDCTDHSFGNAMLMMGVWRTWLIYNTSAHEDKSAGFIAIFSPSIIAPESYDLLSHRVYSGPK